MKARLILVALLAGYAGLASAASTKACDSGTATPIAKGSDYVQADFTPACSTNVIMNYDQDTNELTVCSVSKKGKSKFGGSTNGKAPANMGDCTGGSGKCTGDDAKLVTGC